MHGENPRVRIWLTPARSFRGVRDPGTARAPLLAASVGAGPGVAQSYLASVVSSLAIRAPLLTRSDAVAIPVPQNCALRRNVVPDDMKKYLERERLARKLIFKEWIACQGVPVSGSTFADDPPLVAQLRARRLPVPAHGHHRPLCPVGSSG